MKTIDNKMEQNKAQYSLGRETTKSCALSPGNVTKYEFWTDKDILTEKDLLKKVLQSKDLNIHNEVVSWKNKLIL